MLAYEEGARPTMQQVCAALAQPEKSNPTIDGGRELLLLLPGTVTEFLEVVEQYRQMGIRARELCRVSEEAAERRNAAAMMGSGEC